MAFLQGAWEPGYRDPIYVPQFEKETGCRTIIFGGVSSPMLARIQAEKGSPTVDITNMDYGPFTQAKSLGLLSKINKDLIPNLKSVPSMFHEPDDMAAFYQVLSNGIAINRGELEKRNLRIPDSWVDFGDPIYKGHVVWVGIESAPVMEAVALIARSLGGSESNPDVAFKFLEEKLKPNLLALVSFAEYEKLLGEGSAWLGVGSMSRPRRLMLQGLPVEMIHPKDGFTLEPHTLEIVKDAAHPICANLFLNHALSKQVQDRTPEFTLGGPVRPDAEVPAKLKPIAIDLKLAEKATKVDWTKIDRAAWTDRWNRIFAK
ncbi:MAG: extracellular solute-binding protein [Chloroflexi bacterium]|nr:extracellular solute-binding protein [Chloroflexota bacterium]